MFKKKCYLCGKKEKRKETRYYINDASKRVNVCSNCVTYAERRAMRKANS
jgi:ribosome-binding protein aMBF1 (putative translation factor)